MSVVRYASLIASTVLHGTLALAFVDFQRESASFEAGGGSDQLRIEQGLAIEGLSRLGEAPETIQARDAETVQASQAVAAIEEVKAVEKPPEEEPPPPDVPVVEQPPELKDVITSPLGPSQEIVTAMQPPPELPTPQPEQKPSEYQPEQVAVIEQEAASQNQSGGDATAYRAYLGSLRTHVERFKVRPKKVGVGTVVVKFSVGRDGGVISREVATSSGSQELDLAALSAIDKAAPFPKLPDSVTRDRIDVSIPFNFVTR